MFVHLLPDLIPAGSLKGGFAVVIDVLRASTTICTALEHGAREVIAVGTPEEAIARHRKLGAGRAILGGERGGVRIAGFDLDNSPAGYSAARVKGKTVVFTTTNGTRAAIAARGAAQVAFGCFANLAAVAKMARSFKGDVHMVCAGTEGRVSLEDSMFAGVLAARLSSGGFEAGNDGATLCLMAACPWLDVGLDVGLDAGRTREQLAANMGVFASLHARTLTELGFEDDLDRCCAIDTTGVVPVMDVSTGVVRGLRAGVRAKRSARR